MKKGAVVCLVLVLLLLVVGVGATGTTTVVVPPLVVPYDDGVEPLAAVELTVPYSWRLLEMTPKWSSSNLLLNMLIGGRRLQALQADVVEDNAGNWDSLSVGGDGDPVDDPDDGGWVWSNTQADFHYRTTGPSPKNTLGVTGLGVLPLAGGNPGLLQTALDAAWGISYTQEISRVTGADVTFLVDLSRITGDHQWRDLAADRYERRLQEYAGGDAAAWAQYIMDARSGQGYENGIQPWDVGLWVDAALSLGYQADAVAMTEVIWKDMYSSGHGYFDEEDPTETWYILGLSGAYRSFVRTGIHSVDAADLRVKLLSSQLPTGAWFTDAVYSDEDYQSTAYAVIALASTPNDTAAVNEARAWLKGEMDLYGRWSYYGVYENTEVNGEILRALWQFPWRVYLPLVLN